LKIEILELSDNHVRFILKGSNPAFANALRRIMISEVPTVAIDEIVFLDNTSILYDEILAHRLALVPLKMDPSLLELVRGESDLSKFQIRLILDVEATDGPMIVYSGHLKSEDPKIRPVSDNIPLVKLIKGQKVTLEAFARLGRGKEHAKWSPVSACSYKYLPIIDIDADLCDLCGRCAEYCPHNVLKLEGDKLTIVDPLSCTLCRYCEKVCEREAIHVKGDDTAFIFYVESTGALSPIDIVSEAANILKLKAEDFLSKLKSHLSAPEGEVDEEDRPD